MLSERIVEWTREYFIKNGRDTAVIGISGGKDSAVVAAILVKAIGAQNVYGVLMPNGTQSDISDSYRVVEELGINHTVVNIGPMYDATVHGINLTDDVHVSPEAAINIGPRLRMTVLYTICQSLSAKGYHPCVVGTGNKAEHYIGYFTKWGDGGCDVNPIQDLWVHEVIQVGMELGYFPHIVKKVPADGLCGKSDEDNLGFSYDDVYRFATQGTSGNKRVDRAIERKYNASRHKENPIPYFILH